MGVAYFNKMFSRSEEGFRPMLLESNPLIADKIYDVNLIMSLGPYDHMISKKLSFNEEIQVKLGLINPPVYRFIELPEIIIQHNQNISSFNDINLILPSGKNQIT